MEPMMPHHFTTSTIRNKTPPEQQQQQSTQQPMTPTTPTATTTKQFQQQQHQGLPTSSMVCLVPSFQLLSSPGIAASETGHDTRATALQKHCAFFDLDGDGVLVPWDTFTGFRQLGYGLLMSFIGTVLVHLAMSYPTQPSWIPDPFFSIHLNAIHRCIHGSDTGTYLPDGTIQKERLVALLNKFASDSSEEQKSLSSVMDIKVGWREGLQITEQMRNVYDPFGWISAKLEWFFLWALVADEQGQVSGEAIMAQYDGTLFKVIAKQRAEQKQNPEMLSFSKAVASQQ